MSPSFHSSVFLLAIAFPLPLLPPPLPHSFPPPPLPTPSFLPSVQNKTNEKGFDLVSITLLTKSPLHLMPTFLLIRFHSALSKHSIQLFHHEVIYNSCIYICLFIFYQKKPLFSSFYVISQLYLRGENLFAFSYCFQGMG